jgi:hypothetical protein
MPFAEPNFAKGMSLADLSTLWQRDLPAADEATGSFSPTVERRTAAPKGSRKKPKILKIAKVAGNVAKLTQKSLCDARKMPRGRGPWALRKRLSFVTWAAPGSRTHSALCRPPFE